MAVIAVALCIGCDLQGQGRPAKADAAAVLMPAKGHTVSGVVTFYKVNNGVRIIADITELSPGAHGIHIHEFGDCRAGDASSAGGHFNPDGNLHGAPDAEDRHAGDLGNIVADESGVATLDIVAPSLTLSGKHGIIGRSVVVHADEDDYTTQPSGGAGARLACGTIGLAGK
jgi:Cu-Zn family superoxide dismutase